MFIKTLKGIAYVVLFCCVLLALLLSVIFFKPSLLMSAVNRFTDFEVAAQALKLNFSPLELQAQDLLVEQNQQSILRLEQARVSIDWFGLFSDKHTVYKGDFLNGVVDFSALSGPVDKASSDQQSSAAVAPIATQVHAILTALKGSVGNLEIVLSNSSSLMINQLSTQLVGEQGQGYQGLQQNISLDLKLDDNNQPLRLQGTLNSASAADGAILKLALSEVDLSEYLTSSDDKVSQDELKEQTEEGEPAIDWSWLQRLDGLTIDVTAPRITLDSDSLEQVKVLIHFGDEVHIETMSAQVDWALSEQYRFDDSLALTGQVSPLGKNTFGADIASTLQIDSPKFSVSIDGQFNVNGLTGQKGDIQLSVTDIPVMQELNQLQAEQLLQYLPISLAGDLDVQADGFNLSIAESSFGDSVIAAKIVADKIYSIRPTINLALDAQTLSYISVKNDDAPVNKLENEKPLAQKIFSDKPIDWAWLKTLDVDAEINVQQLLFDDLQVNDVHFPISIGSHQKSEKSVETGARSLSIKDMSARIADGVISAELELLTSDEPTQISLLFDVVDIALGELKVMPQDQLTGGDMTVHADLVLLGDSVSALMANSNGVLYLDVTDAVVQNDTFEVIGSDLLIDLLSKLNPFSKSDPTTEMECATIYVPINSGIAVVDDSLAIQTSKVFIVGDGRVDLTTEKLDLELTPTSKVGVGVNISSLVKFIKLGGTLSSPKPAVDAGGVLASGLAAGAAVSTGGVSLLATGLLDKVKNNKVCEKVREAYDARSNS